MNKYTAIGSHLTAIMTALAVLLSAGGCSQQSGVTAGAGATLVKNETSAAYLDRVSSQKTINENDALRGILMLLDGDDSADDFAQRVKLLEEKQIADSSWSYQADRPITRGKLAYMIYKVCKVRGGIILTLAGPNQRYCLRELQYQGFMTQDGWLFGPVGGLEFVSILTRADLYMQTGEIPEIITSPYAEE